MAQVKIEEVVDHLSYEMRRALEEAVQEVMPGTQFDSHERFQARRVPEVQYLGASSRPVRAEVRMLPNRSINQPGLAR